jgi:hypothetical protein
MHLSLASSLLAADAAGANSGINGLLGELVITSGLHPTPNVSLQPRKLTLRAQAV